MSRVITGTQQGNPDFVRELRTVQYLVATDEKAHFTEALAKNAVEKENISGLRTNRVKVSRVTIQSVQALHYQLLLYGTDQFENAVLGTDRYIGLVDLNLALYGITQTTSQYRLDARNLDIAYEDLDATKELHLVLKNIDPTSKLASSSGEVKLEIQLESMA